MSLSTVEYLSIGGNRNSAASDWSRRSGIVAFGADQNVAIWEPLEASCQGISALLSGHHSRVTAVKFCTDIGVGKDILLSGSADGQLHIWYFDLTQWSWQSVAECEAHNGTLNTIGVVESARYFATGGADGVIKLWLLDDEMKLNEVRSISLTPRYIPLSIVLSIFTPDSSTSSLFLAVSGTRDTIQVFALTHLDQTPEHELQATLSGHEGWIRSLALRPCPDGFLLASASHDKYIRIWHLQYASSMSKMHAIGDIDDASLDRKTLTGRVHKVTVPEAQLSITFEALLLGHEDWIYSVAWNPTETFQLLTASADGSIAIWEPDESSGIWISSSRLGEISGQKGATTATGSSGGLWTGLWSSDGQAVISLGRTGSWRLWQYEKALQYWIQKTGISGHIASTNGLSWNKTGDYLLSTSSDQTTRLHAEWRRGSNCTWHEFSRPQIHGYDLNCVTCISSQRFVSGADEKLLRVFDEPKTVASMLQRLCGIDMPNAVTFPEAAQVAVLGLSNKASDKNQRTGIEDIDTEPNPSTDMDHIEGLDMSRSEPPTEDLLARHTLWPEHEKLYGHGYEINEAETNLEGTVLATACKASSIDHAVIRLYDTKDWHEIKPPLTAHSLTVTRLAFSYFPDAYLLSVGRDRQWTVFKQNADEQNEWSVFQSFPKAHTRMIMDAAWSPVGGCTFFATGGRDRTVKLWYMDQHEAGARFECHTTITRPMPVTALAFSTCWDKDLACLAVGEENGSISLHIFHIEHNPKLLKTFELMKVCPSKTVTRLQWRANGPWERHQEGSIQYHGDQLAVAAADGSVRILRIAWEQACRENAVLMEAKEADLKQRLIDESHSTST